MSAKSTGLSSRRAAGRQMSAGLLLTGLIALGSMLWSWVFPAAEPVVVQAAGTTVQPAKASVTPTGTAVNPLAASSGNSTVDVMPADRVPIYLVGAILNPGIYDVERGSYLYQLVQRAGGLTENAAADQINLALRLDCNQLIRLPTRDELAANPGLAAGTAGDEPAAGKLVDLNQADQDELDGLPGIGPSTALAILEYRRKNGPFRSVEDLMKVPGIKESRFSAIKDLVTISS